MKIASYISTHAGFVGLANRLIRVRFGDSFWKDGAASHTEAVFEPGDGVDDLMPDGTTQPDTYGAVWCASSTMMDKIPAWAPKRTGCTSGVRFKRIVLDPAKWQIVSVKFDPRKAAAWYRDHEGCQYDWRLIFGFIFWPISFLIDHSARWACSTAAAAAIGYGREDFFHPELVRQIVLNREESAP